VILGVNEEKSRQNRSEKAQRMTGFNAIIVFFTVCILQPFDVLAWNIPGHMLSGAIA